MGDSLGALPEALAPPVVWGDGFNRSGRFFGGATTIYNGMIILFYCFNRSGRFFGGATVYCHFVIAHLKKFQSQWAILWGRYLYNQSEIAQYS